jgi:hypothetical protein
MEVSRRRAFLLGIGAVSVTLPGCSVLSGRQDHELTFKFANCTDREKTVGLRLIDPGADDHGDAVSWEPGFTVPVASEDETAGMSTETAVVPRQQYIVSTFHESGNRKRDHFHLLPGENSTDGAKSRLIISIDERDATGNQYVTPR